MAQARVDDLTKRLKERDEHIRESWIRAMEARLVRDKLQKCYRLEGVNHLENCKDLADQYTQMLKDNRVHGYKNIDV